MKYRREIDGLRSLALLPVILYHAGFHTFSGGFVGVDIFFVISGYLITSIILTEQETGSFTLTGFYARRVRRILPALYLILLVSSLICLFTLSPTDGRDYWQSQSATVLFASNILFFIKSSDYFALAAEYKPLLHTWSLAVEEQYYLLYPLILLTAWRFGRKWLIGILIAIATLSLTIAQWAAYHYPAADFYLLPTRGWELLLGAFVAFYFHKNRHSLTGTPKSKILSEAGGTVGLVMIGWAIFSFDRTTPFPSLFALLPTVGAVLIVLFATPHTQVGKILGNKLLVGIGLISYSAYLWHQPLLAFARYYFLSDLSIAQSMIVIAISFGLSVLSWRFIEQPFRKNALVSNKFLLSGIAAASLVFFSVGVLGHVSKGFQDIKLSLLPDYKKPVYVDFFAELDRKEKIWNRIDKPTDFARNSRRKVLILGDSMSGDFLFALTLNAKLLEANEFVRQDLPASTINAFLMFLVNPGMIESPKQAPIKDFDNLKRLIDECDEIVLAANWTSATISPALKLAEYLAKNHKQIYVVDTPRIFHMSASSFYFAASNLPINELDHFMYNRLSSDYFLVRQHLRGYFSSNRKDVNITLIDKGKFFCDFDHAACALYSANGLPFIFDDLHLTLEGIKYFGNRLEQAGYFAR